MFTGTLLISAIAMLVAIPIGLYSAIYLTEYAHPKFRAVIKPLLELLAGIPTVVYGFFAVLVVAPAMRNFGDMIGVPIAPNSALAAGGVMGIMIIPFVSSLSDDAIAAVPRSMREGSYAMGATKGETITKVLLPAALPGIMGGIFLAVSRAIGETMIVVMAAGIIASLTANPLAPVTTVTVQIVTLLIGDTEFDNPKTLAAFALGLVLFLVTLALNVFALHIVRKYRRDMSKAQTIEQDRLDWASPEAKRRVRRRYGADWRLQAYGIAAIALAIGLLGILLTSLVVNGFPAFVQTKVDLEIYVDPAKVDAKDPAKGNYRVLVRDSLASLFPDVTNDKEKADLTKILTSDAAYILRDYVVSHPDSVGKRITLRIPVSDPFDQLNKGVIPKEVDALSWSQVRWFERLRNRGVVVEEGGRTDLKLEVYIDPTKIEAGPPPTGDFAAMARDSLQAYLPDVHDTGLFTMLADDAPDAIKARVTADPALIGKTVQSRFPSRRLM